MNTGAALLPSRPGAFKPPRVPTYNKWPGTCANCKQHVEPKGGELVENPIRVVCALCLLRSEVTEDGLRQRLETLPRKLKLEDGTEKELNLLPFQVEDAWRTHTSRALLLAQQPGCGKTIVSAMGALRTDMLNLVFCPASVRENWKKEIELWRPDLAVETVLNQEEFAESIVTYQVENRIGTVLVGSFGALPGSPCYGCQNLHARLVKLKKEGRYHGSTRIVCTHYGPDLPHPDEFECTVDKTKQKIPYSMRKTDIKWQVNPLPEIVRRVVLLADECHAFKTRDALRTKNFRAFRERIWAAGGHVYGLSGTPCEGKPGEFWEVLVSLGLERAAFSNWDNYYRIFKHWFDNPKGMRLPPNGELRKELHARLKPIQIVRRRKDVLSQLPPRIEEVIELEISEKTIREVDEAVHHMLAVRRAWEEVITGGGPLRLLNPFESHLLHDERERRKQLYEQRVDDYFKKRPWDADTEVNQAVQMALTSKNQMPTIEELAKIRAMLSMSKIAAVQEWLSDREQEEEPVVLFSQHVSILKKITQGRPGWQLYYGGLTAKKRFEMVEAFQAGKIENGLAVSIGAGGVGITLVRARVCAFVDLNWNPAMNFQAESRLIRIGAEKHDSIVVVKFVAKHCVDRLVVQTLDEKAKLLEAFDWAEDEERQ